MKKQTKFKDPQQISFISKLLNRYEATMFFIIEKSEDTTFNFSQNSVTIIEIMETQKMINLLNDSNIQISKFAIKNGMLLTVSQNVIIHTKIQSNF